MEERTQLAPEPALLDVNDMATLLACGTRTVYRLSDAGRIPRPVKLGTLVRWRRSVIQAWLADGCPNVLPTKGGRK